MRIISGSARGKRLQTFKNKAIRPTSDRVREAIFSIITSRTGSMAGLQVLDICAGTGALGLEALSRGASKCTFIDNSHQAAEIIAHNSKTCTLSNNVQIIKSEYTRAMPRLGTSTFDLIFIDPPYNRNMLPPIIECISNLNLLAPDGIICAEESSTAAVPDETGRFICADVRTYGDTSIYLFQRKN